MIINRSFCKRLSLIMLMQKLQNFIAQVRLPMFVILVELHDEFGHYFYSSTIWNTCWPRAERISKHIKTELVLQKEFASLKFFLVPRQRRIVDFLFYKSKQGSVMKWHFSLKLTFTWHLGWFRFQIFSKKFSFKTK